MRLLYAEKRMRKSTSLRSGNLILSKSRNGKVLLRKCHRRLFHYVFDLNYVLVIAVNACSVVVGVISHENSRRGAVSGNLINGGSFEPYRTHAPNTR